MVNPLYAECGCVTYVTLGAGDVIVAKRHLMRKVIIRGPLRARTGEPDLHLIGYLRGSADRVAEMIIVDLVESGVLRLASKGKVAIAGPAADPLGESALATVTLAPAADPPYAAGWQDHKNPPAENIFPCRDLPRVYFSAG